ncbi:MAG: efflux RND transporter periplasmic adaptor subunit [Rhodocyclaceae bacterium]|nr:efflux RND transporter periplasmic adaptor subunit [Rhodocyclaceae bacterium]
MTQGKSVLVALVVILAAAGGYWAGQRGAAPGATSTSSAASGKAERKLLYYRNPMGLPDTSPVPKKDNMGMDYIPVYEGEEAPADGGKQLNIGTEKVQKLGVRVEAISLRPLDKLLRVAGRVEVDERRIHTVAPKFEGWIEKLYVNATGQAVAKGEPLFEVYSPELLSAQKEYAIAAQGASYLSSASDEARAGMQRLADSALARLRNWDIPPEQIQALEKSGEAKRTLTFRAPAAGVVTEKKAVQGMRFSPGDTLYQVVDVSSVWVLADVYEQDIAAVHAGSLVRVRLDAYPGKVFEGKVDYVYPTLKAETRTVPVRIVLANPGGLLKPAMYAQVEIPASGKEKLLTVPVSAVIDSGTRKVVLVQMAEGKFEPREVKLGARSDDYVAVLEGLKDGEKVVVNGNFLIDAESNLKAALGGFASAEGTKQAAEAKSVGHQATGTLDAVDAKAGTVTVTHQPIASLKWPKMTMDFVLANPSLVAGVKPGAKIAIEIVERKPGEWVITSLKAQGSGK